MMYLVLIPIIAIGITFAIKYQSWKDPVSFVFRYSAKTKFEDKDHAYKFNIKKTDSGYKCYIEQTPSFRGRSTINYTPHYWSEALTGKCYICWTGKIKYPEQAKTLCRNWADATQLFIDTGKPAPGFGR